MSNTGLSLYEEGYRLGVISIDFHYFSTAFRLLLRLFWDWFGYILMNEQGVSPATSVSKRPWAPPAATLRIMTPLSLSGPSIQV